MPLINRTVVTDIPHNFAKQNHVLTKYVHPTRLRPGDKPVPLHEISDRQLSDLATLYPDEYLQPCLDKGLEPAVPVAVEDESLPDLDESKPLPVRTPSRTVRRVEAPPSSEEVESGDDEEVVEEDDEADDELATIPLDEAQRTFLTLNAVNAIGFINQNKERSAFLGKCYQAEKARVTGPRKTVLAAFTAAGVGAEE